MWFWKVGGGEEEFFADHVGVLLVPLMKPINGLAGDVLDDRGEAVAHELLKRHPLFDHGVSAAAVAQGPLHTREAACMTQTTRSSWKEVLACVRSAAVVLLPERDGAPIVRSGRGLRSDPSRRSWR